MTWGSHNQMQCSKIYKIIWTFMWKVIMCMYLKCLMACSHWIVVGWCVFRRIPLKDKLPVIQMTCTPPFLHPAKITLLKKKYWFNIHQKSHYHLMHFNAQQGQRKYMERWYSDSINFSKHLQMNFIDFSEANICFTYSHRDI